MPDVSPSSVERLARAYAADRGSIVVATHDHERGNPALFDAVHFDALAGIEGDRGGRELIVESDDTIFPRDRRPWCRARYRPERRHRPERVTLAG
jgi:molybdenum cofactor cytidylyltransferase